MSYVGRADNITVTQPTSGTVKLSVYNPQAWDNEPSDTSITIPTGSINNLIAALRDIQTYDRDQHWGDPWDRRK